MKFFNKVPNGWEIMEPFLFSKVQKAFLKMGPSIDKFLNDKIDTKVKFFVYWTHYYYCTVVVYC